MTGSVTTLRLLIPGLLGPWPGSVISGWPMPELPMLQRLLARSRQQTGRPVGRDAVLFEHFAVSSDSGAWPVAALSRLAERGDSTEGYWLRVDPVHLKADLRQVMLFSADDLAISADEADQLITAINELFADEHWQLQQTAPSRWYLRLDQAPAIRTRPLSAAIGQDINPLLPSGPDSRAWRTRLTEIQMLLYHHPVNQDREQRGLPTINSVWFWGEGRLPVAAAASSGDIFAADPLTRGLARLTDQSVSAVPDSFRDWQDAVDATDSLVVLDGLDNAVRNSDFSRWAEQLTELEKHWFEPLSVWLGRNRQARLILMPCRGDDYHITYRDLWRFWRRDRSLIHYL